MKYVTHKKLSSLTPAAQAIRDTFSIKLTRAKERHAEAMGFNSFNHLSEIVKKKTVKCDLTDYSERLKNYLSQHHNIDSNEEQFIQLENLLHIVEEKSSDEFYIYRSKTMLSPEEYEKLYNSENEMDLDLIVVEEDPFDLYYEDEYSRLINGEPMLVTCGDSLANCYRVTNGIFFIVSKHPLNNIKISEHILFEPHLLEYYKVDFSLSEDNDSEDTMSFSDFVFSFENLIRDENEKIINQIKKDNGYLFPTILTENLDAKSTIRAIENNIRSHHHDEYPAEKDHFLSSTVVISNNQVHIELKSLNIIYEEMFDSEFLEAYSKFYYYVVNKFKDDRKNLFIDFYDFSEDIIFAADPFVYFSNVRNFKNNDESIHAYFQSENSPSIDLLAKLFIINDVETVSAHSALKHGCGGDMIMGCNAFDENGKSVMKFQIFIGNAHQFHHEFLKRLKEKTNIKEFKVVKNLEYNLEAPVVEVQDECFVNTFSYPENNQNPTQLAFLVYKFDDYTKLEDLKTIDLLSNDKIMPYIKEERFRDAIIGRPMFLPTKEKEWYPRTKAIMDSLKKNDSLNIDSLRNMMIDEFYEDNKKSQFHIMASPVIFNLAEDDFSEILLRYQACNQFDSEFKNAKEMSKALNVDIHDYMLIVGDVNYEL